MQWRKKAIHKLWDLRHAENNFDTPLLKVTMPYNDEISIFLKDESKSKTGSLKHRFSWMLFMWGIENGFIKEGTHIFEFMYIDTLRDKSV
eukprot:Pgem_evm1s13968